MTVFKASRISPGNNFFPIHIQINGFGITLNKPGFLSFSEKTIAFANITAIKLHCQFLGYSAITIKGTGYPDIKIGGFSKMEVRRMKQMILANLQKFS
ncbi:MAG TPA: hypothetical protein VGO45_08090 [Bacteroidia bacterium]|jgi:hypothetical protein|nr:hypothetical protein [Bacteroidia bacterium]